MSTATIAPYVCPFFGFRHDAIRPVARKSHQPLSTSTRRAYVVGSSLGMANSSRAPLSASVARNTSMRAPRAVIVREYPNVPMVPKPVPTTWSYLAAVSPSLPRSR